jgi:hypothetical protein
MRPPQTSFERNFLDHEDFGNRVPEDLCPGRAANPQPADQPLPASLKRPMPRLLAHLKQLPSLARKSSRKSEQVVPLSRPITAAPIDVFPVADPQQRFELGEDVFEKIRRALGGFLREIPACDAGL